MKALALAAILSAAPAAACNLPASRLLSLANPPLYSESVLASAGLPYGGYLPGLAPRHTGANPPSEPHTPGANPGTEPPVAGTPIVPLPPSVGHLLGALAMLLAMGRRA